MKDRSASSSAPSTAEGRFGQVSGHQRPILPCVRPHLVAQRLSNSLIPVALTIGMSAWCSAALGNTGHRRSCVPRNVQIVAENARVRVYTVGGGESQPKRVFACLMPRGTPVRLGGTKRMWPHAMSDYRLAGTIVAYADRSFGVDSGCTSIIVIDVATRRQLRAIYQVACYSDAHVLRFGEITDLVVSPDGSTAWIGLACDQFHSPHCRAFG